MKKHFLLLPLLLGLLCGCSIEGKPKPYTGTPLVILDTDIGSSTDDLFAIQMLLDYEQCGKCQLLGVVVDRVGDDCAACADVMTNYFGSGTTPLALVRNGLDSPKVWIDYQKMPYYTLKEGNAMFSRTLSDYSSLPDGWQLYRLLLSKQPDHSVSICSIGFVACMAQLLQSKADEYSALSGKELVRQKVKCLYMQGGVFGDAEEPDFNLAQGPAFAQTFFDLWPQDVDIVFSPMEVGQLVEYTPEQVISDVHWTDVHPIKQVYMTCNCNTGQRMWDVLPVVQAVEGDSQFALSERGIVRLTPQCATIFTPAPSGNCRYQLSESREWAEAMLQRIRIINSTK